MDSKITIADKHRSTLYRRLMKKNVKLDIKKNSPEKAKNERKELKKNSFNKTSR